MTTYITTDPQSEIVLEHGKMYFMDFSVADMPYEYKRKISMSKIAQEFIGTMSERGHYVSEVHAYAPNDSMDMFRIRFRANPLHVYILVALAVGIVIVAVGLGAGAYTAFMGLGELPTLPFNILKELLQKPWAAIAIVAAVGVFFLGWKIGK